jgi:WD40 repeat protein
MKIWNKDTGSLVNTYYTTGSVNGIVVAPDNSTLVTGSYNHLVRWWNMQTQTESFIDMGYDMTVMHINPINGYLVTFMHSRFVMAVILMCESDGYRASDSEILMPSGNLMISAYSGANLIIYHGTTGSVLTNLNGPAPLGSLKQLPDFVTVVCALNNGSILIL